MKTTRFVTSTLPLALVFACGQDQSTTGTSTNPAGAVPGTMMPAATTPAATPTDPAATPGATDPAATPGVVAPATDIPPPSAEQVKSYLRYMAPVVAGRSLSAAESGLVDQQGAAAIQQIIAAWGAEPGFVDFARNMLETRLSTAGVRGDIDMNLPGYTINHVVMHQEPWSNILTAPTCYTADDQEQPCDTGAPYTAGVLATRAFTAANEGRFNLGRALALMDTFACRGYPQEDELEPRLDKDRLLVMFRAQNKAEQAVAEAAGGFGNGFACYTCHGQFSAHSQLFVKFDGEGHYVPDASGLQNPDGQLGASFDGLYTSHMINEAEAASENSQMFGQPVANLAEAAGVIANHDVFYQCSVENLIDYAFLIDPAVKPAPQLLQQAVDAARAVEQQPTLQQLAVQTFSNPSIVATLISQLPGTPGAAAAPAEPAPQ